MKDWASGPSRMGRVAGEPSQQSRDHVVIKILRSGYRIVDQHNHMNGQDIHNPSRLVLEMARLFAITNIPLRGRYHR
jgi:hypothetical protein